MSRLRLLTPPALAGLALVLLCASVAAVSGGGYSPSQQGCSPNADSNSSPGAEPGCHNANLVIQNSSGATFAQAGTDQQAQGQNVRSGDVSVAPGGTGSPSGGYTGSGAGVAFDTNWQPIPAGQCGLEDIALYPVSMAMYLAGQGGQPCTFDPTKWSAPSQAPTVTPGATAGVPSSAPVVSLLSGGRVYFGADDNLDSGEHDGASGTNGTAQSVVGPSDGGAVTVTWSPWAVQTILATLQQGVASGDLAPVAQNPFPMATVAGGACADGICIGAYTARTVVYQGGGGGGQSRDVYDYSGKTWDPYDCSSGSVQDEAACISEGGHTMDWYRRQEASNVYAEPGVQIYEDPDPQASPALPAQLYPLPAAYAGTCGVTAGGGAVQAPASPITNNAGQVSLSPTGC